MTKKGSRRASSPEDLGPAVLLTKTLGRGPAREERGTDAILDLFKSE